jgi:hypothetical protein
MGVFAGRGIGNGPFIVEIQIVQIRSRALMGG